MKTHGFLFKGSMIRAFLRPRDPKTQTRRVITAANSLVDGAGMSKARWDEMHFDFSRAVVDQGPSPAGNPGPYLRVPARNERLNGNEETWHRIYPRIDVGDVIYAKETWSADVPIIRYRADSSRLEIEKTSEHYSTLLHLFDSQKGEWRSAMFMPQWAARIRRKVVAIRPEPLLAISAEDAKAEGLTALSKDGTLTKYGIPDRDGLPGNDDDGWPWAEWRTDPVAAYFHLWDKINGPGAAMDNPRVWVYTLGAE